MAQITVDILIVGGGLAGLMAAARLGSDGHQVLVVDPLPRHLPEPGKADLRTTAYLRPGIATLEAAGVWPAMAGAGAQLATMRIIDAGGAQRVPRKTADFRADELHAEDFGWNVPNALTRTVLMDRIEQLSGVRYYPGAAATNCVARDDAALIRLSDGCQVRAQLIIAADGRDSKLRSAAGISHRRWHYGQKALVCSLTHNAPHENISTEIHRTGGPLTLVPMPDHSALPCSSLVWMMPGPDAMGCYAMSDAAFAAEVTAATMGLWGPLRPISPRAVWPVISQIAHRLIAPRMALIAESAHVVPPIGAQGLNMSLADIECLAGLLAPKGVDTDIPALLARYERARLPKVTARVMGIDLLNRAAMAQSQPLRDARRAMLSTIHRLPPIRRAAMALGLGEMNAETAAKPVPLNNPRLAAIWMLGAIVSFSMMAVAGRTVIAVLDSFELLFYRSLVGLLVVSVFGLVTGRLGQIAIHGLRMHIVRNLFHFSGQNCWFTAIGIIPLAQVFAFEFTAPIWIALLSPLVLKERLSFWRMVSVIIGFIGLLIVARPGIMPFGIGQILAITAALCFAGTYLSTKILLRSESIFAILFWLSVIQALLGFICAGYDLTIALPDLGLCLWLVVIGVCGISGHMCLTFALRLAPAALVAPMDFLRLPLIALVGMVLYDEPLDLAVFIGGAIILTGNLLNIRAENRAARHLANAAS